jgi:hypothetical protein
MRPRAWACSEFRKAAGDAPWQGPARSADRSPINQALEGLSAATEPHSLVDEGSRGIAVEARRWRPRGLREVACRSLSGLGRHSVEDPGRVWGSLGVDPSLPQIGRYPTLGVLGAGGMGTVYLARHPELEFELAIKVLLSGRGASEAQRRRFRRETRALEKLRHPGLVEVVDAGEQDGVPWLAMRRVAGESLEERLRPRGHLPSAHLGGLYSLREQGRSLPNHGANRVRWDGARPRLQAP